MASDEYERPARRPYLYQGYYIKFKSPSCPTIGSKEAKRLGCLCQDPEFIQPKDYDDIRRAVHPDCPLHEIIPVKPEDLSW